MLVSALAPSLVRGSRLVLRGLRLRLRLLSLKRLRWGRASLVALVFAAAPATPRPLRLSLAVGQLRPQFRLRLRRFCRHAYTSYCIADWYVAVRCVAIIGSAISCRVLYFPYLPPPHSGREGDSERLQQFQGSSNVGQ